MVNGVESTVSIHAIYKSFGSAPILKGVSLELAPGEVLALAGENGAGKSTLIKIIAGQVRADAGTVLIGESARVTTITTAHQYGVAIVPQELAPVLDLTVYENIFLGRELLRFGMLDRKRMKSEADALLAEFGIEINSGVTMRVLSVAVQQIVEIIKSSSAGASILLLDEPTSAISEHETARLYAIIHRLKQRGVAMVYTTHKMAEIRAIADRVAVLRDGVLIKEARIADITDDEIVTAMIGRELDALFPTRTRPRSELSPAIRVSGLRRQNGSSAVDLEVFPGEIVALAGLVGAGRTELVETIMGVRRRSAGSVEVGGLAIRAGDVAGSIAAGMAIVPEDRKVGGLVLSMGVVQNAILPHLSSFATAGWVHRGTARAASDRAMDQMHLRSASSDPMVSQLSGGNQQKVVLGRWLVGDAKVMLLDEPTRGVDVGARSEIYRVITELARSGMAVLMASSDMPEVLGLAHRVLVIRNDDIVGTLEFDEIDAADAQNRIFRLASGMTTGSDS